MKTIVTYDFKTHTLRAEFESTEYFCPSCGKQTVWVETGEGDYYVGPSYYCTSCCAMFNLSGGPISVNRDDMAPYRGVVEQLRKVELERCSHANFYQCYDKVIGYYQFCADCKEPLNPLARMLRGLGMV